MPTPNLPSLGNNPSLQQIADYIVRLQRDQEWLLQNLDDMNVRRLRADVLYAGVVNAGKVTIRSDLTAGAYVQIDGSGMVINNGSFNTFTADTNGQVTMTRALIQSNPSGYPRIVMDPVNDLFAAYSTAANYAAIRPNGYLGVPALDIRKGSSIINMGFGNGIVADAGIYSTDAFEIRTPSSLYLSSGNIVVTNWSNLYSGSQSQTLQQALDGLQSQINTKLSGNGQFGLFFVSSTLGGPADTQVNVNNGLVS